MDRTLVAVAVLWTSAVLLPILRKQKGVSRESAEMLLQAWLGLAGLALLVDTLLPNGIG